MPRIENGKCTTIIAVIHCKYHTTSRAIQLKRPSPKNYTILCVHTLGRILYRRAKSKKYKIKCQSIGLNFLSTIFGQLHIFSILLDILPHNKTTWWSDQSKIERGKTLCERILYVRNVYNKDFNLWITQITKLKRKKCKL